MTAKKKLWRLGRQRVPSAGATGETADTVLLDDDQAPGTSTEEDYLEDDAEEERLAEEARKWDQRTKGRKERNKVSNDGPDGPTRRDSLLFQVLRWPLLILVVLIILVDLVCYFAVRLWVSLSEFLLDAYASYGGSSNSKLMERLQTADSYAQWKAAATDVDIHWNMADWKCQPASPHYDYRLIQKIVRRLSRFRARSQVRDMVKILKHSGCKSNVGGIHDLSIYSFTHFGTKHLIDDYVSETVNSLEFVARSTDLSLDERHAFFKHFTKVYGRTALCLSGGASLGYFHIGIVKALMENHLLPNVITGSSAGSLIAAIVCCRTDQELKDEVFCAEELHPHLTALADDTKTRFKRFLKTGAMFDYDDWFEKMKWFTMGHLTFLEAYLKTGRILNVSVVSDEPHAQPKLLNYITAPDVLISTAVIASSSIPGLLPPIQLLQKDEFGKFIPFRGAGKFWRDGSLRTDIPERELNQLFNVQYTIVSQMNPHIVLFFYNSRGSSGSPAPHRQGRGYRGGFVGYSLVQHFLLDLQKWMALLRDTDLLPKSKGKDFSNVWLQRFEGNVTILPPPLGVSDFVSVLSDPTLERLQFQIDQGQVQAWPKIRNIENRMRIEHSLAYWRHYLYSLSGNPAVGAGSQLSSARESLTDFHKQFPQSPVDLDLSTKSFLD